MLDTNICIHLMQRQPEAVMKRFSELQVGDVVMSSVTYAELRSRVECRSEGKAALAGLLDRLTNDIPVLPLDREAAEHYGELRAAEATRGKHRRDALDRLIAAHARSRDLVLVTNNEADFRGYPGLRIENWVCAN
ncbi:MAG TPA: type II toxin-antitoxin system VapC family toxin [Azospira sp.]|nr:type II toxin-antitoxin system VapC family toxin [Azospira sp.]HNN08956.1 type II toxin-antitoxin system VapC family toxin [Azospira sp.]HNN44523.1 type II toxin-antitoxin system VapC family toxin [Azospira sp.]